jgi:type IV secretion system protein TrbG
MLSIKILKKLCSIENITILFLNVFLMACTSPNIQTEFPPPIEYEAFKHTQLPTKAEFLKTQEKDVSDAYHQYEKSGYAPVIESEQITKLPFGQSMPVINCTPLRTCEIKLEIGERLTGVYPGDTTRWLFEEAVSGEGLRQQMHVIFKPKDYDIVTNAIITTSKRTYHIELHSQKDAKIKQVEFYYPSDIQERIADIQKATMVEKQLPEVQLMEDRKGLAKNKLDFSYRIEVSPFSEKPVWTPVRVFNEGSHVYIQIPEQATTTSLPALFIVGNDGEPKLVNYRVLKPYYIVDELFEQAVLEIGVGQDQQRVKITHRH